jgi:membrane-associated phospholipid phosphatase
MSWLAALDTAVFRFIHQTLSNPVMDRIMPLFSGNPVFIPAVVLLALVLLWKGGARARVFVVLLLVIFALGDMFVVNTVKKAVARPRPYEVLADVRLLAGKGNSGSMPSSHTSTWFAATLITFVYYRRSWRFMLPLACLVGLSRIYVGVHYPSDVLAGAIIGVGYAAAGLWTANTLWRSLGQRWFHSWWSRMPDLLNPVLKPPLEQPSAENQERLYFRMGWLLILVVMVAKYLYIAGGVIQLAEDEAYQWTWSKHLALSYYSKPPLIAYAQFLGTSIWGDNAFGVRFLSPLLAAGVSLMLLHFFHRHISARAGFWLIVLMNCTPFLSIGSTLLTIDPLLVFFWTAAMLAGWRAVQLDGRTRDWIWAGIAMGLAFLAKYSAIYQIVCFGLFFVIWPASRNQLKKPGPYLAVLVMLLFTIPVIVWNAQHGWITIEHVSSHVNLDKAWQPTLRFFWDFTGVEAVLLNPFFFLGILATLFLLWKNERRNPLLLYFFCMGPVVFLGHWLYSLHSRIHPNWIAPAIVPMLCLVVAYWHKHWSEHPRLADFLLKGGIVLGLFTTVILHETSLVGKITGRQLPALKDPLRRVRMWAETAQVAGQAREQLLKEGKPVFIIAGHYGLVGHISFYLPEARQRIQGDPLAYFPTATHPKNQFYFWPGYKGRRTSENAIFVREVDGPDLPENWFQLWLKGSPDLMNVTTEQVPPPPPPELLGEFDSVEQMGIWEIKHKGRVFRYLQIFACRNLH